MSCAYERATATLKQVGFFYLGKGNRWINFNFTFSWKWKVRTENVSLVTWVSFKEALVRQKPRRTGIGYLVGMDIAGIPLHAYPRHTRFSPKKKISIRVWYGLGTGRVRSGTGWDKTKPKRRRFRVKLKPYLSSSPDSQPLDSLLSNLILSLLYSRFSLSLTSSLHRQCTQFSLSHFFTLPATGDGTEGVIVDLRTCGKLATQGLFSLWIWLWYFFISFLILDLIALIVVWLCGIFVNMLWVCVSVINDNLLIINMYGFVFVGLTCYGLVGIDFSVNNLICYGF